jgi:hypothetical protein
MNMPKHHTSPKHSPGRTIWVSIDLFETKKLLKALRYQLKMLKSILNRVLAIAKKIPVLVNLSVKNMKGKNY